MSNTGLARGIVGGLVGAGAVAGTAAFVMKRRARTVVRTSDVPRGALLRTPSGAPDELDVRTEDGATLRVRCYGPADGDPIVLVHGWTCSTEYWNPQINALSEKNRVIAYDLRGHGSSTIGSAALGPDLLASDLAAVLAATVDRDRKAELVGHSMGGMSIIAWAERYPEQVAEYASAVLLASTATDNLVAESLIVPLPARLPRVPVSVGRAIIGSTMPIVSSPLTAPAVRYIALSPQATREEVEFCRRIVSSCHPKARGGWGAALSALDIHEGLANLTVPTSVLVGTADRLTPPSHANRLAEILDGAGNLEKLIVLPGVGHMTTVEDPDAVNEEIARLRSLG
ncbi:alpha/beta hydrolase [Rhodococcus sp. HNM0569]|uniref:alpha/beta fold hydrolase n=1 Tax=Rhodococcus sp. HNM0569 TaxID=2716340 RepID=UPI00146F8EC0|nr:alpha/beta hydrolase [Rhodococcus sp. HNM0569]NLU85150.1 alpha/beta hydrolase [Rhodococcus sp. HNM0569]